MSDDDENELSERFQKLGIKKLHKIQERQDELGRKKREAKKKNGDVKCFHTTQQGERCTGDRLWQDGLLFCT